MWPIHAWQGVGQMFSLQMQTARPRRSPDAKAFHQFSCTSTGVEGANALTCQNNGNTQKIFDGAYQRESKPRWAWRCVDLRGIAIPTAWWFVGNIFWQRSWEQRTVPIINQFMVGSSIFKLTQDPSSDKSYPIRKGNSSQKTKKHIILKLHTDL
jgi:hypothetical protein